MDKSNGEMTTMESEQNEYYLPKKANFRESSPRSPFSSGSNSHDYDSIDIALEDGRGFDTSIDQLYRNVCDMQSSDQSPSGQSFLSYGQESRIDSELRFLAGGGGGFTEVEKAKETLVERRGEEAENDSSTPKKGTLPKRKGLPRVASLPSPQSKRVSSLTATDSSSPKNSPRSMSFRGAPPAAKQNVKTTRKPNAIHPTKSNEKIPPVGLDKPRNGNGNPIEAEYIGPYLLKQVRELISSGDNINKALDLALRALRAFENSSDGKPNLDMVMCLHIIAAIYCNLGQYSEVIPILEQAIEIPSLEEGQNHALAKFSGCMQLGDTYATIGQIENSILFYSAGLEIQRQVLGEKDCRLGETCRYVAEAHLQALQFDEAENLCLLALEIHKNSQSPASLEEAADRRLLGLISDSKGDYEAALEQYVLASMAMSANGQEAEMAAIDCSIGDAYLSLIRFDEAVFAYQKALTVFKSTKGENHPSVASVFVRLGELYQKSGKLREAKSYCENALRIYAKPVQGSPPEEISSGLIDVSAIYESMNEPEQALKLLQKALTLHADGKGQHSTIAGIEAQMGVLYYMIGNYSDSYKSFKNAISKFREIGEKKSALFGIALNQMGLACVQLYAIEEAAYAFEEAMHILETEYGPYHPDTLAVYSNLAGTYDALGRSNDAIQILEYLVEMREDKLGTANPDVDDEKRRLAELLKEAGQVRKKKSKSLETLLDSNWQNMAILGGAKL
ncbi:protein KINESIN LIGHT CHAIN-RELATED 2-like [Impatiens glandulifera]|uniref:protein KINESIN LIGHT CHAIN-RELATED 2-like n=1 Tax=Impatiens glandulifera TaxID=253017 RepID=UPI001FB08E69|nr:protein KINESIN LIGHT CHAIN-RELATED 2-like [Impatiens glandulifera]